jgi:Carbamoyltransferase C-terminus
VPAVVNTSFNLAGEPNVFTVDDAISTFLRGRLDVLAAGDHVVEHPEPAEPPAASSRLGPELTFTPWAG